MKSTLLLCFLIILGSRTYLADPWKPLQWSSLSDGKRKKETVLGMGVKLVPRIGLNPVSRISPKQQKNLK